MGKEKTSLGSSFCQQSTPCHKKISSVGPSSIYSSTTADGDHFCTPDNFKATVECINHQLDSQGFPAPLRFINNDKIEASKIINCMFTLLEQIRKDNEQQDVMDNLHNQQSQNGVLNTNMTKLKQQLEQRERDVNTLGTKLITCEDNLKAETLRHKDTREELQKAKQNLQYFKTQYAHELRKREQEYGKLKDRMQKVLNDKYKGSKISLTLVNPAPKSSTLPPKSGLSPDEELSRENLSNYEERERMVLDENQSLRNALITLYKEIEILLRGHVAREGRTLEIPSESVNSRYNLRSSTGHLSSASFRQSHSASISAETARFQMPFDMAGAHIIEDLKVLLSMLKKEWESRPANKNSLVTQEEMQEREHELREKDEEIEKLKDLVTQLDERRYVAEEQNNVISDLLSGNFFQNANEEEMLNMSGMEFTIPEVDEEAESLRREREQLDQERRQFTEAAIKFGRERAALRAEREAFNEERRSVQTQAMLFSLPDPPYWLEWPTARPVQSTPTQAASINSILDLESWSPSASLEPSSNSKLLKNRTPHSAEYSSIVNNNSRRAPPSRRQTKDEDDDIIMDSDTLAAIPMGASQHSRKANSKRRTSNATNATNPGSQFPKSALRSSVRGNTIVTPRNAKEVTIAAEDKIFRASFATSVGKLRERSFPIEEVNPPRANKHPRLDSAAVREGAEFNNDTERKNYPQGQDAPYSQPTRATVRVSRVKENIKPSTPASQRKMLLQSANAKFRATGAISPTPISTSSRSLASVATKAAAAKASRRQLSTMRSMSSAISSHNSSTSLESSEDNSRSLLVKRAASDKMTRAIEKRAAAVASAAQEEAHKSRRVRGKVSSGPSKASIMVTTATTRGRRG